MQPRMFANTLAVVLLALSLSSCRSYSLADEPQDLIGPGKEIAQLRKLGWSISEPQTLQQLEADTFDGRPRNAGAGWERFKSGIQPGDQLRRIGHNAGVGVGLFRNDRLVDSYLSAWF